MLRACRSIIDEMEQIQELLEVNGPALVLVDPIEESPKRVRREVMNPQEVLHHSANVRDRELPSTALVHPLKRTAHLFKDRLIVSIQVLGCLELVAPLNFPQLLLDPPLPSSSVSAKIRAISRCSSRVLKCSPICSKSL